MLFEYNFYRRTETHQNSPKGARYPVIGLEM